MTLWEDDYPEFYVVAVGERIVTVTGDKHEAESVAMFIDNAKVLACVVDHVLAE